ncbi:MAG TPA: aminomethyl-transferring glycine dehydrogenase subunit GcvPB [Candidatus Bathyarchaeia archaeon]|nr:aminomethyl-transferring glycine dehydrogenase subunit GcvPB [Candidatus Bathyarchaeia archaeon]
MFHQATWNEPLIIERSRPGKIGHNPERPSPTEEKTVGNLLELVPSSLRRDDLPKLPELSEPEVMRHFIRLSQQNYSVDTGIYPLGSCTMKYSPKVSEIIVQNPKLEKLHPEQDESTVQGILSILYKLDKALCEITGMSRMSLQPAAGAHGEYLGALIIRAYHRTRGEMDMRDEMIVPDSAHGTNPASAAMAGFKVKIVSSSPEGIVDLESLKRMVGSRTAGLMITNPNTLGIFEREILEIAQVVHEAGGMLYYDGANFNPILGKARPGDMGFDIVHLNLHKTFATPHGGGGPGAGPVGVTKRLERFLPVPLIGFDGKRYYYDYDVTDTVGKIRAFHGNIGILVRAYSYILSLGADGLRTAGETSVLNTNYVLSKIMESSKFDLPFSRKRKHEFVLSTKRLTQETGVRAMDIAKRMLDFGLHSPTVYFPQIVDEALMIETPESESIEDLDRLVEVILRTADEAKRNPDLVKDAPHNTSVRRIDEVKASHPKTLQLNWRKIVQGKNGQPTNYSPVNNVGENYQVAKH